MSEVARRFVLAALGWAAWGCVLLGCSDEDLLPLSSTGTAGAGTGGAGGGFGGEGGEENVPPGPPIPVNVPAWMVATVANASNDPIRPAIEDGTFELPAEGSYLGKTWKPVAPGAQGELVDANADLIYAAALVQVPEGRRLLARGDTVATIYTNDASPQPGDFYHSRRMRVPLGEATGDVLVVVRAFGRRATPEIQLWSSDAEIVLNMDDATLPDLVEGTDFEQWAGVPVLNLTKTSIGPVRARVLESDDLEDTIVEAGPLAPGAVTQVPFSIVPKRPWIANQTVEVKLRVESADLDFTYEKKVDLAVVGATERYRRTRLSEVDGSVQYYAVMPPSEPSVARPGLLLSLHGAGVEASGQAAAYSPKSWAWLVAPTNRRPFGFDWEEWGRLDAIEALEHASAAYGIDPTRVHLTGHSMGGHGTWHVGVHFAGRFGVIGPSAAWISFETYGGPPHPEGPVGRARAASKTLDYTGNLADRSVYIIHGAKDDNVPVSQAHTMHETLLPIVPELAYYEDPNGRHWWDNDPDEEGADCVDYEPMIAVMETTTRDPNALAFTHRTPAPWISPRRSFVTIETAQSPLEDCVVSSSVAGSEVTVTTTNVRTMVLDGSALAAAGITSAIVDGQAIPVTDGPIEVGAKSAKTSARSGPLNQVFHRPFCFVWEDGGPSEYRAYAALLTSWWSLVGNGHACGLPRSAVTADLATTKNLVFLGVPHEALPGGGPDGIVWGPTGIDVGGTTVQAGAIAAVFANGQRLAAAIWATPGSEHLLWRYVPFSSRAGMPDFFAWTEDGVVLSGFFDADWKLDPAFGEGF